MKLHAFVLAGLLIATPALAGTEMVNDDWVLTPQESHSVTFTLPTAANVFVEMTPVKHADKGVRLRIVPVEDFEACAGRAQGQCRSRGDFDGFAVRSFSHTGVVPAGRWVFFVQNTENILERAIVHVHMIVNP